MPSSQRPKISLTLIVKNESKNLKRCLESVIDLVDEIIIVDTGSTDDTRDIAASFGATIIKHQWKESFSEARNCGIDAANGEWIFWLDADEYADADNQKKLGQLFRSLKDENAVYMMYQLNPIPEAPGEYTLNKRPSLFRNRPDIRWRYRVHEQILPAIKECGGIVKQTNIRLNHTADARSPDYRKKLERYLSLLKLDEEEFPDNSDILFQIGHMYHLLEKYEPALTYWKKVAEKQDADSAYRSGSYYYWSKDLFALGRVEEALAVCNKGVAQFPTNAQLLLFQASLNASAGNLETAQKQLEEIVEGKELSVGSLTQKGLNTFYPHAMLGQIHAKNGNVEKARKHYRKALEFHPNFSPALNGLAALDQSNS